MATVQNTLLKLAQRVDPRTKNTLQVFQDSGSAVAITNATNATPIVVTAANHGLNSNDLCYISGVVGNTAANNTGSNPNWTITKVDANTFSLNGSIGNGAYTSGGTVTGALIGSADGKRFTRQRLLDIYNDARIVLAQIGLKLYGKARAGVELSGIVTQKTNLQFATGVASKPSGFVDTILLTDVNNAPIAVVSANEIQYLLGYESATLRFVIDMDTSFKTLSGVTYVPDASSYILWYYGLTPWTLAQVLDGTTNETYQEDVLYILIEIAEAMANEFGSVELNGLAARLLKITPGTPITGEAQ